MALVEVKLGNEDDIVHASNNLINIAKDIDYEKKKPAFLMVVTKKVAYRMDNGVYIVPLC